jgi:hypothetical protein
LKLRGWDIQTKSKSSILMYKSKLKAKTKKSMDENLYIIEIIQRNGFTKTETQNHDKDKVVPTRSKA